MNFMQKLKEKLKNLNKNDVIFIVAILIVTIMKQAIVFNVPIAPNVGAGADDGLMVKQTANILSGKWIGGYDEVTFLKGVSFPLILTTFYFLHIEYVFGITLTYSLACLGLIYVLKKVIKNRKALFLIYTFVLFNPLMFSNTVICRVYRNSIVPAFAIALIAVYLNLFFKKDEESIKKKIPNIIVLNVLLAIFWYLREDSIWIVPFAIFISGAILISIIYRNKKINKEFWQNLIALCSPIVSIFVYANIICIVNYSYYGVYTVRNDYYYNKAVSAIESVKAYDEVYRVTNTREKMNRIAEVTVFGNIMPEFNKQADAYAKMDGNQTDDEVENGWFKFAFNGALLNSGYFKDADTTNNFYNTLAEQIEEQIAKGTLEKEDKKLDIPEFLGDLGNAIGECLKSVFTFDGIELNIKGTERQYKTLWWKYFEQFENVTHSRLSFSEDSEKKPDGITDVVDFKEQNEFFDKISYKENIVKNITSIYKVLNYVFFTIGMIYYIYLTIYLIVYCIRICKNKDVKKNTDIKSYLNEWIITSSILGVGFTIVVGISYTVIKYFYAVFALYLVGIYPILLVFDVISVYNCTRRIYSKITTIKSKK